MITGVDELFTDVDKAYQRLYLLKQKAIAIGVLNQDYKYPTGERLGDIATAHEMGSGKIPRRSFISLTIEREHNKIQDNIGNMVEKILDGGVSVERFCDVIGLDVRNKIIDTFTSEGYGTWQKLSLQAQAIKQSDQILFDTGVLRNSINYEVK